MKIYKTPWLLLLLPILFYLCKTLCILPLSRTYGGISVFLFKISFIPFVFCMSIPIVMLILQFHVFSHYGIKTISFKLIFNLFPFVISFIAFLCLWDLAGNERDQAIENGRKKGELIIYALEKYMEENGSYPEELSHLRPRYMTHSFSTGMCGYPSYIYEMILDVNSNNIYEISLEFIFPSGVCSESYLYIVGDFYCPHYGGEDVGRDGIWNHHIINDK